MEQQERVRLSGRYPGPRACPVAQRRLVALRREFLVVVPLEYESAGAPPPSWFIDALMRFHAFPYHVSLLSAASLHGAAAQQPQELQVMTNRQLRPVVVEHGRIRYLLKKNLERTPKATIKTGTGSMQVSTPEATAADLVRYAELAGGWSNGGDKAGSLLRWMGGRAAADGLPPARSSGRRRGKGCEVAAPRQRRD